MPGFREGRDTAMRSHPPIAAGPNPPQRIWRDAGEGKEVLIHRVAKFVIPSFAGERGAGFVNDTGQHDITAEADAGAAWGTLG
jgi:hypothetical protein